VLFTPPVGRGNKLSPKHRGPFHVIDKTDSIYIIEDLVSGKRITTHIRQADPIRTNPLTVAQINEQEFIVESILDAAATAIDDPPCNSTSDGLARPSDVELQGGMELVHMHEGLVRFPAVAGLVESMDSTAGNRTRPSCMWTSSMITCAPTP
jgi:hypothetical protein